MSANWRQLKLGDLAEKIAMGPFGSSIKVETFVNEGVPVISGAHLHGVKLLDSDYRFVSEEHADKLKNANVFRGDVIFTHAGTIGQVSYIPENSLFERYVISQRQFYLRCDRTHLLPEYVTYYFKSHVGRSQLLANASQVGVPSIAQPSSYLKQLAIPVPSVSEQEKIVEILSALDDKIALNRRLSETLEAIAQALFQSWFVDFDPVRAKAIGEAPEAVSQRLGLTPELLALFPDRLVESELGEIPQGWDIRPLDQIANYLNGLALQKFPPISDKEWLPVIKIAQLKSGSVVGADRASHELKPEYIVDDGDVLFSWSGSLEVDLWCNGRGALNQHLFKVTSDEYPKWFYFLWTKHHLQNFRAIAAGKAVTMGHIQRKHLTEALCASPSEAIIEAASTLFAPMLLDQIEIRKQSRELSSIRDVLLPKLLSGEIQIPEEELP